MQDQTAPHHSIVVLILKAVIIQVVLTSWQGLRGGHVRNSQQSWQLSGRCVFCDQVSSPSPTWNGPPVVNKGMTERLASHQGAVVARHSKAMLLHPRTLQYVMWVQTRSSIMIRTVCQSPSERCVHWNVHGWRRGALTCELQHCHGVHAYVQPRWWHAVPGGSLGGFR